MSVGDNLQWKSLQQNVSTDKSHTREKFEGTRMTLGTGQSDNGTTVEGDGARNMFLRFRGSMSGSTAVCVLAVVYFARPVSGSDVIAVGI